MRLLTGTYFIIISVILSACFGKPSKFNATASAPFLQINSTSVDSLIETMTLDEKVEQLIWVNLADTFENATEKEILKQLKGLPVSNILYNKTQLKISYSSLFDFQDTLNAYSKIPYLFGLAPNSTEHFGDYELASIKTDSIFQQMVDFETNHLRRNGLQIHFNANINSITLRDSLVQDSLFDQQLNQSLNRHEYLINAFQEKGELTGLQQVADLHIGTLDTALTNQERLFPYQNLAQSAVSLMVLDNEVFDLDTLKPLADNAIRNYLVDSLYFGGIAISHFENEKLLREQLRTGSDAFIVPLENVPTAISKIKKAVQNNVITEGILNFSVRKNLLAKEWSNALFPKRDSTFEDSTVSLAKLSLEVAHQSISILKNEANLLPITNLKKENVLLIAKNNYDFWQTVLLEQYAEVEEYELPKGIQSIDETQLKKGKLDAYDKIIIVIAPFEEEATEVFAPILPLAERKNVILVYAHNPNHLDLLKDFKTIVYTPSTYLTHRYAMPDIIYGSRPGLGGFPIHLSTNFQFGQGIELTKQIRLRPAFTPEEVGCKKEILNEIDAIVQEGINGRAMPSCQVMVIKNGAIVYDKYFGHHTYDRKVKVNDNHLYDLASITKVVSTTMALMKLYQQGKYSLSDSLYQVFGEDTLSTVGKVTLRELLIHQSGIQPFMPILRYLKNKDGNKYFSNKKEEKANIKIANNFYAYDHWLDTLWREMTTLELQDKSYRYSDVNANILQRVVETLVEERLDEYVYDLYYKPLNMQRTLYNPLDKYPKKEVVPTEKDKSWRKQLVHGYVHDESAAFLGGVAGNAGLFSTAHDLAVLSQMLLNGGHYGNQQFLQPETINLFAASTHGNHRGLGFNKQTTTGTAACSQFAPLSTYGHTGFTGNCFWIDPENEVIYIFLSNRVYPKRNPRLSRMQIRERIHDVVYRSFEF